jgi:tRNA modification GTPase
MDQALEAENDLATMARTGAPDLKSRARPSGRNNIQRVMPFNTDDTICAVATAPGGAGRGMVRVSGLAAVAIAERMFEASHRESIGLLQQATAIIGYVRIGVDASRHLLPCDLFLWPTHKSYTREPIAEFHTVGSPPLLGAMVMAVCGAGARLAEPGEFTLRAFLAGRLDLTQAEAVLGVIDARGNDELDMALIQLAGGLARPFDQLRDKLLQLLADVEAGLDFVEEDIQFISSTELHARIESAGQLLNEVAKQMDSRNIANDAPQIALVGPPNVGKSSLFNALVARFSCNRDSYGKRQVGALVSPRRGTTRDYLTATISLNGMQCELIDTAGVDGTFGDHLEFRAEQVLSRTSTIDRTAQSLASERREQAAICAYCVEASSTSDQGQLTDLASHFKVDTGHVVVLTKADTLPLHSLPNQGLNGTEFVLTSSYTGQGLDELCAAFSRLLIREESAQQSHVIAATASRCRESVRLAAASLTRAGELVLANGGNELVAVELRAALAEIGCVVGAVYTDDLLDRIFGTFCIGK